MQLKINKIAKMHIYMTEDFSINHIPTIRIGKLIHH